MGAGVFFCLVVFGGQNLVRLGPVSLSMQWYINCKDNAMLTGDRMKILMLSSSFMVRDLIAPEVSWDIPAYHMLCI